MFKKVALSLICITLVSAEQGALPSCTFKKTGDKKEIIELKSKLNEQSLVQLSINPLPDKKPTDGYRLVNMKNPKKKLFFATPCDLGYSQLFQNATKEPAQLACYRCEHLPSCTNNCLRQDKLEAETEAELRNPTINCYTNCTAVDCSKIISLTKCEKSDRSTHTENNTDRILGLVEAPAPANKK